MFIIQLQMRNPMSPTILPVLMEFQFDPATMTVQKWTAAYDAVKAKLDELSASSVGKEPAVW